MKATVIGIDMEMGEGDGTGKRFVTLLIDEATAYYNRVRVPADILPAGFTLGQVVMLTVTV